MTLIDIDPLKERIDKDVKEDKVLDGWAFFIKAYLDSEPHINIVWCKKCKHHFYDESNDCKMCYIHEYGEIWEDDDYCSYGEREDE